MAEETAKVGRPTDYKPELCEEIRKLVSTGATDSEIADYCGVSVRTLYTWRGKYPEFLQALKATKEEADAIVERSLFQRATGYEVDSVKIFCDKEGNVTKVPFREIVPPDPTSMIFWLKNRKPDEWRDKLAMEHMGELNISLANAISKARKRRDES